MTSGMALLTLDLWNPHVGLALWAVLATPPLLGMVHGVTPDEHTWPITFSCAVGGHSSRAGMRNALIFSAAFTLQRPPASELAYLAPARFLTLGSRANYIIYLAVGSAMVWAARYVRAARCRGMSISISTSAARLGGRLAPRLRNAPHSRPRSRRSPARPFSRRSPACSHSRRRPSPDEAPISTSRRRGAGGASALGR